jgi:hypothetical protein
VALGEGLAQLPGYPVEVRHSDGARPQAIAAAEVTAAAFDYFTSLFSPIEPDLALIVVDEADWSASLPYGLAYFNDDVDQIRPGILVMPAGGGEVWPGMARDIRDVSADGDARLLETYPDGQGGIDLRPFFELVTVHELAHAFETAGDLRFPTHWLSEIFVNLALHAFVAERQPARLPILETLPRLGAESETLAERMRREGDSTLEQLQAHYPGGDDPMDALNYVWFQYRWMRLAAAIHTAEGEAALQRLWSCFRGRDRFVGETPTARSLAPLLTAEVSPTLARAIATWR